MGPPEGPKWSSPHILEVNGHGSWFFLIPHVFLVDPLLRTSYPLHNAVRNACCLTAVTTYDFSPIKSGTRRSFLQGIILFFFLGGVVLVFNSGCESTFCITYGLLSLISRWPVVLYWEYLCPGPCHSVSLVSLCFQFLNTGSHVMHLVLQVLILGANERIVLL